LVASALGAATANEITTTSIPSAVRMLVHNSRKLASARTGDHARKHAK
jgi:hypothetical protein